MRAPAYLDRPVTRLIRPDLLEIMEQYPFTLPHLKTPLNVDERRREACLWIARLMAHSGWHHDYRTIEAALKKEYPEAAPWFESAVVRNELRHLCSAARHALGGDPQEAYGGLELSASSSRRRRA
jgi:hypothetical protein